MRALRLTIKQASDPRVRALSPPAFRAWVLLGALAASQDGVLPAGAECAQMLGVSPDAYRDLQAELAAADLLTDATVAGLSMPAGSDSTPRVRALRARRRLASTTVTVTPTDVTVTVEGVTVTPDLVTVTGQKVTVTPTDVTVTEVPEASHEGTGASHTSARDQARERGLDLQDLNQDQPWVLQPKVDLGQNPQNARASEEPWLADLNPAPEDARALDDTGVDIDLMLTPTAQRIPQPFRLYPRHHQWWLAQLPQITPPPPALWASRSWLATSRDAFVEFYAERQTVSRCWDALWRRWMRREAYFWQRDQQHAPASPRRQRAKALDGPPLDAAKYTTGKYAHLFQQAPPPADDS